MPIPHSFERKSFEEREKRKEEHIGSPPISRKVPSPSPPPPLPTSEPPEEEEEIREKSIESHPHTTNRQQKERRRGAQTTQKTHLRGTGGKKAGASPLFGLSATEAEPINISNISTQPFSQPPKPLRQHLSSAPSAIPIPPPRNSLLFLQTATIVGGSTTNNPEKSVEEKETIPEPSGILHATDRLVENDQHQPAEIQLSGAEKVRKDKVILGGM